MHLLSPLFFLSGAGVSVRAGHQLPHRDGGDGRGGCGGCGGGAGGRSVGYQILSRCCVDSCCGLAGMLMNLSHIHIHTYTHTHIHAYTHTYTHAYIYIHTHTYTHNTHTYTHTRIYTCTHIYTHIHRHTHIHTPVQRGASATHTRTSPAHSGSKLTTRTLRSVRHPGVAGYVWPGVTARAGGTGRFHCGFVTGCVCVTTHPVRVRVMLRVRFRVMFMLRVRVRVRVRGGERAYCVSSVLV